MSAEKISGYVRFGDGRRVPLTDADANAVLDAVMKAKAERAEQMPDATTAARVMCDAFTRLKELGWREARYAPKNCAALDVIEAGSSGIHRASTDEDGRFWIYEAGDVWPSHPVLFRSPTTLPGA